MSSHKKPRRRAETDAISKALIGDPVPSKPVEPIEGEIVDDGLDDQVDEINSGLTHIVSACRRGDGRRTSYWVGKVARQMALLSKQVLRATLVADAEGKGNIITP